MTTPIQGSAPSNIGYFQNKDGSVYKIEQQADGKITETLYKDGKQLSQITHAAGATTVQAEIAEFQASQVDVQKALGNNNSNDKDFIAAMLAMLDELPEWMKNLFLGVVGGAATSGAGGGTGAAPGGGTGAAPGGGTGAAPGTGGTTPAPKYPWDIPIDDRVAKRDQGAFRNWKDASLGLNASGGEFTRGDYLNDKGFDVKDFQGKEYEYVPGTNNTVIRVGGEYVSFTDHPDAFKKTEASMKEWDQINNPTKYMNEQQQKQWNPDNREALKFRDEKNSESFKTVRPDWKVSDVNPDGWIQIDDNTRAYWQDGKRHVVSKEMNGEVFDKVGRSPGRVS